MTLPDLSFENAAALRGARRIAGVDEVGRGPLAGPVVAAAVILGREPLAGLNDSKELTAARREALHAVIIASCTVSIAAVSALRIDAINIRNASLDAMRLAIDGLAVHADHALIDGNALPHDLACPAEAIVKGDGRSQSIAAASVVAKVVRDRMMVRADELHPGYGFAAHKGYGTKVHRNAIAERGPCPLHRMTFAPLRGMSP